MPFTFESPDTATPQDESGGFSFSGDSESLAQQSRFNSARDALTEMASASGGNAAGEVRNGRPVQRYGTQWEEVQQRLEEQHPNSGLDMERAQEAFQQIREQNFNRGLLRPVREGEGERDEFNNYVQHIPVARHIFNIQRAGDQRGVRNRIEAGTADQRDYFDYQQRLRDERYNQDRPDWQKGVESLAQIPVFGGEMALAAPFAGAAAARVGMPLGAGAASLAGRAIQGTPGWLAGAVAGYNAGMPAYVASSIFQRLNPHVGEEDATAADAFKGWLDGQIEIASESLGEPLQAGAGALLGGAGRRVGSLVSRLPGGARAAAIANGLTHWATENRGSAAFREGLRRTGFDGLFGEWLEERAGEVARGATGVEDHYGFTGNVGAALTGDRRAMMAALDQLTIEGISFGGWTAITGLVGASGAERALHRLQSRGMSRRAAQTAVTEATVAVLRDPSAAGTVSAPLREFAQGVADVVHAPAQGPQPGMEAMPVDQAFPAHEDAQGPQPGLEGMPEAQLSGNSGQLPEPVPEVQPAPQADAAADPHAPAVQTPTVATTAPAVTSERAATEPAPDAVTPPKMGVEQGSLGQLWERVQARREIADRMKAGESVSIEEQGVEAPTMNEIATAAKLNPREAHILFERMSGRTLDSIASDRIVTTGKPITRERVRQLEAAARKKAGIPDSIWKDLSAEKPVQTGQVQIGEVSFTREQMRDPALQASVRRAKSPLSSREARAKAIEEITDHVMKGDVDGANQALERAGRGSLSPSDLASLRDFANQHFAQIARQGQSAVARAADAQTGGLRNSAGTQAQAERLATATQAGVQANAKVSEPAGPITPDQLKAVADISPHHAVLLKKAQSVILATTLPIATKMTYLRGQLEVLSRMQTAHAEAAAQNLKEAKFYGTARELTESIKDSAAVKAALKAGQYAGGAFNSGTGIMRLDGAAKEASVARTAGHEYSHVGEGKAEIIGNSPGWKNAWTKELAGKQLTDYAAHDVHEGLAEIMGEVLSGEMSTEALWQKFPLVAAELEGHGWIAERSGNPEFVKPADIFDYPINDGPLHADIALAEDRLHVSPEFDAARAQISPQGEANSEFATNAEAIEAGKKEAAMMFRQRFDDRMAVLTDIGAEVAAKRKRTGLPEIREGDDLRTVFANSDRSVQPWAEKIAAEGAFILPKAQDGSRTMQTIGKSTAWVTEGMNYKAEDFQPLGTDKLDALKRKFNLPVAQGGSRFETTVTALHAVHQVERGQAMLDKYKTFITPEQEAVAARLTNTVSVEQFKAFDAYLTQVRNEDPQFFANANESLRRLTQLNDWTLDMLESVGFYSAADKARIKRDYPDYISLARVMDADDIKGGGSGADIKASWEKKRHGSGRQIVSPILSLQSRYAQTAFLMAKQLKDEALLEAATTLEGEHVKVAPPAKASVRITDLAKTLTAMGISEAEQQALIDITGPELVEHFGAPKWNELGENIYVVRVNGERVPLEITNKHVYNLYTNNQVPMAMTSNIVNMVLGFPGVKTLKPIIQFVATKLSPTFWVRNPLRDPHTALQNRTRGVAATLAGGVEGQAKAAKAAFETLRGQAISDPIYKMYNEDTGQQVRSVGYVRTGKGGEAFRKLQGTMPMKERILYAGDKAQDLLELIGSPEHAWRFAAYKEVLEENGYTPEKIEKAQKARPDQSPIPLHVRRAATQRAAERTTDFGRQGIDAREYNQVKPFFSAELAGASQELRNIGGAVAEIRAGRFGPKAQRMTSALATLLAFELLHWWLFKDKEWYKNLPKTQRYGWWNLYQMADGTVIGIPKPHGLVITKIVELFQETLRTVSGSEARFGMATGLDQPLSNVVDSVVGRLPVVVSETAQVFRNRDWRGANIVPTRDLRELNDWEQFRKHQLPYVINQWTGGLTSGRLIQAVQNPLSPLQSSRAEPNLPVNEYYSRLEELTGAHQRANRTSTPLPPDQAQEYARLHSVETLMRNLARESRGENGSKPSPERLREIRQIQNRLARRALGLQAT